MLTKYVYASGTKLYAPSGEEYLIRGIAFGNEVWGNPKNPSDVHHDEQSYKEISELGFNSVRFYLNYGLFDDDSNPYIYKESGFEWLDKNIAWAKKYDIKLVLNMHYPQGGYQSQGNGMALWTDAENQNRESGNFSEMPALPLRGQFTDQSAHDTPVGSGLLILAGLGLAYGLKRRK